MTAKLIRETRIRCKRTDWVAQDMPKPEDDDVTGWLQWAIFVSDTDSKRMQFLAGLLYNRIRFGGLTDRQMETLNNTIQNILEEAKAE